jgi:hypothetical protein
MPDNATSPWTDAAQGAGAPGETNPAPGKTNPWYGANAAGPANAALSAAQNPDRTQAETEGTTGAGVDRVAPAVPPGVVLRPVHSSPIARAVDKVADFLAGRFDAPRTYQDQHGNTWEYSPRKTRGEQWRQIAGEAAAGAAAGMAAGKGAGNQGKAAEAGIQAVQAQQDRARQQQREQTAEQQAQQLSNANYQLLQMKIAEQGWMATRRGIKANEADVQFYQGQVDRLEKEGGQVLGTVAHANDIGSVLKVNPNLMKDMIQNHQIELVPAVDGDGKRSGVTVVKMPGGYRETMLPPGQRFPTFDEVSGDYVWHESTDPMTAGELDDYVKAAGAAKLEFQNKQQDLRDKDEQRQLREEQIKTQRSEQTRNVAEAAKANTEAKAAGAGAPQDVQDDIAEGLASGRYLMGKDLPLRTPKDQATAAQYTKAADDYSRKTYGLPYSPEIIRQESKLAEAPHTQAFLSGIDRMVGTPGIPGQLDQVLALAKRAGITQKGGWAATPFSTVRQWVKERLGVDAAKQLETNLSDTQTALGTLIGNPLLGSGESDLKLRTAQEQYGKDMTIANLEATNQTVKEVLTRARAMLARNNRYIQQRYGNDAGEVMRPAGGGTVQMRAPDGSVQPVPADQVRYYQSKGATVVQ